MDFELMIHRQAEIDLEEIVVYSIINIPQK